MSLLTDSSNNNFRAVKYGNTVIDRNIFKYGNGSAYFDGAGDYLELPLDSAFDFGSGDFTIEFWAYTANTAWQTFLARWGTGGYAFFIGNNNGGPYGLELYLNTANGRAIYSPNGIPMSSWNHIAVSRNGASIRLFLNGTQVGSTYNIGTASISSSTEKLKIGEDNLSANPAYNGYMDDLRITKGIGRYSSNFTPPTSELTLTSDPYAANVSLLMNFNPIIDSSTNNATLSEFANAQVDTKTKKYGNGSFYFDGTGDCFSFPTNDTFNFGNSDFTIEFWYLKSGAPQSFGRIFQTADGDIFTAHSICFDTTSDSIRWDLSTAGFTWNYTLISTTVSSSEWRHFAFVRNGNYLIAYQDGIKKGSAAINANSLMYNSTHTIVIGGQSNGLRSANGYLDDLRVTRGITRYGRNITVPTAEFDNSDIYFNSVSLLLHMNGASNSTTFTDSSSNNFTITVFGDTKINTTIKQFGTGSAIFDGAGDYLRIPYNTAFAFGSGDFTFECWIYPTSISGIRCIYATSGGSGSVYKFVVHLDAGVPKVHINNLSNINLYHAADSAVSINTWTHIAYTRTGDTWTWYINGKLAGIGTNSTNITYAGTEPTYIGYGAEATFAAFIGYIDELRVTKGISRYNLNFIPPTKQLLEVGDSNIDNVYLLLNGGTANTAQNDFRDYSKNNRILNIYGNTQVSTSIKKMGAGSIYFDGSGDYIQSTITDWSPGVNNEPFTIEMWTYSLNITSTRVFISKNGGANSWNTNNGLNFNFYYTSAGQLIFGFNRNGTENPIVNTVALSASQWYHLAVVYDGSVTSVFVNGIKQTNTSSNSYYNLPSTNNILEIGGQISGTYPFYGYIDELRITKGVARYNSNFIPHTAPFNTYKLTPFSSTTLSDKLFSFWKLDNEKDSTNYRNNLTNYGNITFTSGKLGNCALFNSSGQYFRPLFISSSTFSTSFTFSCWFKGGSQNINAQIIRFPVVSSSNDFGIFINFNTSTHKLYVYRNTTSYLASNTVIGDNNWHHIAVTLDSAGNLKTYVDGNATPETSQNIGFTIINFSNIYIGRDNAGNANTQLAGYLDAIGLWNRVLTTSEISSLYNGNNGLEP